MIGLYFYPRPRLYNVYLGARVRATALEGETISAPSGFSSIVHQSSMLDTASKYMAEPETQCLIFCRRKGREEINYDSQTARAICRIRISLAFPINKSG